MYILFLLLFTYFSFIKAQHSIDWYKETDKKSIIDLCVENKKKIFGAVSPDSDYIKEYMAQELNNNQCQAKVIREHNQVTAFILYKFYKNEDCYSSAGGHIKILAVNEKDRRRGCGTALLKDAIQDIKKSVGGPHRYFPLELSIFVQNNNENAKKLYEKLGFKYKTNLSDGINMMYKKRLAPRWWFITQYPKLSLFFFYGLIAGLHWNLKKHILQKAI